MNIEFKYEFKYDVNTEVYVVKQFASGIIKIARDVITQCLYDGKKLYYLEKNHVTEMLQKCYRRRRKRYSSR